MPADLMLTLIAVLVVANLIGAAASAFVRSERARRYDPNFVTFAEAAAASGKPTDDPNFVTFAEAAAASGKPTDAR